MTRQHLLGDLSLIPWELEAASAAPERDVARLRLEAETTPPDALTPVVASALDLAQRLCWDSLSRGETASFVRRAEIAGELWELGVCARLVAGGH